MFVTSGAMSAMALPFSQRRVKEESSDSAEMSEMALPSKASSVNSIKPASAEMSVRLLSLAQSVVRTGSSPIGANVAMALPRSRSVRKLIAYSRPFSLVMPRSSRESDVKVARSPWVIVLSVSSSASWGCSPSASRSASALLNRGSWISTGASGSSANVTWTRLESPQLPSAVPKARTSKACRTPLVKPETVCAVPPPMSVHALKTSGSPVPCRYS